jgi:hypothetical protein
MAIHGDGGKRVVEVVGDVLVDRTVRRACGVYPCSRSMQGCSLHHVQGDLYDCSTPVILSRPKVAKPPLVDAPHIAP